MVTDQDAEESELENPVAIPERIKNQAIGEIKDKISAASLSNKRDDSRLLSFVSGLLDFSLEDGGRSYDVVYEI